MSVRSLLSTDLDRTLAILGIIGSVILILFLVLRTGRLIYTIIGFLTLGSCIFWLATRKGASLWTGAGRVERLVSGLLLAYVLVFILMILSLYLRPVIPERPLLYFILASALAGIIALEIAVAPGKRHLILPQIVVLGVTAAWSQLLIFPDLVGIDPWWHRQLTDLILSMEVVPLSYPYSFMPAFHLEIANTGLIAGLDYRLAAIFSVGMTQIICSAFFLYLLGRSLLGDERVGLFASLAVIIANQHINMSFWSIPNAFAAAFILVLVYLLIALKRDHAVATLVLSIPLMAAVIITHSIAAVCLAIILFASWAAFKWYTPGPTKRTYPISLALSVQFVIGMLAWWNYASGHLWALYDLIRWGFSRDYFVNNAAVVDAYALTVPVGEQLFNNIGMFLFFSLSFIGLFYLLSRRDDRMFAMAIVGLTLLSMSFFPMILGLSLIEHRWWYFAQIFLSVPLAVTLLLVIGRGKIHLPLRLLILFVTIGAFSLLMFMSPPANVDNPLFSPNSGVRASFTEPELQAIATLPEKWDRQIGSDRYVQVVDNLNDQSRFIPLDGELLNGTFSTAPTDLIMMRDYIAHHPFYCYDGVFRISYHPEERLVEEGYDKVYDSSTVSGFHRG